MKFRALLFLALFLSHSWLSAGLALVTNRDTNNVTFLNTITKMIRTPFPFIGKTPKAVAITPDGKRAFVCNSENNNVVPILHIDTDHPVKGFPNIDVGNTPVAIAIAPDGKKAFVCNSLSNNVTIILDIDTDPTKGADIDVGSSPMAIAITPDGKKAFVCNAKDNTVTPIHDIDTVSPSPQLPITVGIFPDAIAITPDGKKAFVCNRGDNTVIPIDIETYTTGNPILVTSPYAIAITPDGKKAFVCTGPASNVTPIHDIDTDKPSQKTSIALAIFTNAIAITPDGKKAFVCSLVGEVTPIIGIDTDSPSSESPIDVSTPTAIAITPDQAPTAAFNVAVAPAGSPSTFDAIASSSPEGAIAKYEWDFGDGNKTSTDSAITSHTYKKPETFKVTLTVTNTAKTSTEKTFTGQTVSNNGGPSATLSKTITIQPDPPNPPAPPKHFVGNETFNKFLNETDRILSMTWKASSSKGVAFYRIFKNDKVVAKISAKEPLTFTICLNSSHNTKGYEIVAVTKDGIESTRVKLKVK